ncbi:MAG TPA: hypothetical protein VL443_24455 [Cyclobacteriaceae bacterium]|jgi:co-chaperonin GroES (HSP10)|nr:hypothetical protein [Cyclobacteriaceae bacterium]
MIEPIQDYFTVAIDSRYPETKTKAGIILINTAWIDDKDMDRNEHKRIYGTVLSVPKMFSENGYRAIDDGMPAYHKYVGHDDIVDRINRGYRNHSDKAYYPSTYEKYDVVTMADIAERVDVKVGDKVYFLPQCTEDENMLEKTKEREVYQINVAEIICVVRDNKIGSITLDQDDSFFQKKEFNRIIMQGEWVLIKPDMETWDEITSPSGIILKTQPDKKWLQGIVAHSGHDHLIPGTKIVYLPNADCSVKVEDEEYFVMPAQDVIGELK